MYRTELRPAGDRASYPILRLPKRYHALAVERITVADHEHPKIRQHLVDLTVDDLIDSFRLSVAIVPHPRWWIPERRRSYPRRQAADGQPSRTFAEEVGRLRYSETPAMLRGINAHLDYALLGLPDAGALPAAHRILGHGEKTSPVYGPHGFTWVPPDGPFDFRSRAYRDIPKSRIVEAAQPFGPVDIVNLLLGPPLYIRRATVEVAFR
jgi:hypothetical protein